TSFDYLPHATADLPGNPDGDSKATAALEAFNAPISILSVKDPISGGVASAAALRRRLLSINGEFGGGGGVSLTGLKIAERGVYRLLAHLGMMELDHKWRKQIKSRLMTIDASMFIYALEDGVFVRTRELGEEVSAGDTAGHIVFPERPEREPIPVLF